MKDKRVEELVKVVRYEGVCDEPCNCVGCASFSELVRRLREVVPLLDKLEWLAFNEKLTHRVALKTSQQALALVRGTTAEAATGVYDPPPAHQPAAGTEGESDG